MRAHQLQRDGRVLGVELRGHVHGGFSSWRTPIVPEPAYLGVISVCMHVYGVPEAQVQLDVQRLEHRAGMTAREEALKEAPARHAAREHRLLSDIDRERLAARQAASELAKEHKLRTRDEEESVSKLETERAATRAAEKLAEQLRT